MATTHTTAYGWLMLAGIFVSIAFWSCVAKRDSRLVLSYIAALAGAIAAVSLIAAANADRVRALTARGAAQATRRGPSRQGSAPLC